MLVERFLLVALMAIPTSYACSCSEPTVQEAKQRATVIFRGSITALRQATTTVRIMPEDTGKIAVFHVTRVWKGAVGKTFEMRALEEGSACWGFSPQLLKVGAELIVYAFRAGEEYYTSVCTRTRFVRYATKDVAELGLGTEPKPIDMLLQEPKSK